MQAGAGTSGPETDSRFNRTIRHLQVADAELRVDFAITALGLLAQANAREAELAREDAELRARSPKLLGWAAAVDQYANRLLRLRGEIDTYDPPQLSLADTGPLAIRLGESMVIIGHPRPDQQSVLEQQILTDFCRLGHCDGFAEEAPRREPIPVSSSTVKPQWQFAPGGAVCVYRGIAVHFANTGQLARARLTCEQFLQEVEMLADEIAWQRRHGVRVRWDGLSTDATPGRTEHIVRLNTAGDTVLATVPVIHGSRGLLQAITPWIRARVEEGGDASIELDAADYGWEPGGG